MSWINLIKAVVSINLIALLYSIYRRGYWVSRRFYITNIMPQKNTSEIFSILMIVSELSSIFAGYVGAFLLDDLNMLTFKLNHHHHKHLPK